MLTMFQNMICKAIWMTCAGSMASWAAGGFVVRGVASLWQQAGRPQHVRILDIGTGAGDMPPALLRWGQRHGVKLTVVGLDNHAGTLRYAASALRQVPEVTLVRANGLLLPCRDQAFDIVLCSTMLHHLQPTRSHRTPTVYGGGGALRGHCQRSHAQSLALLRRTSLAAPVDAQSSDPA